MIYAINYADKKFKKAQRYNTKSAYHKGKVDYVYEFDPSDIDVEFYEKNRKILEQHRGNDYYLWKPYFIHKVLCHIKYGDWLVYSDSGGFFYQNSVKEYIYRYDKRGIEAIGLQSSHKEANYTKRDAFVIMNLDTRDYTDTGQWAGGLIILKKTQFTIRLVKEWLKYAQDERIITDMENVCGLSNYEGFIDNRHDQSIFSLLAKKYGVYSDENLWCNMENRKKSPSVFVYHHTTYGGPFSIWFNKKIINKLYNVYKKHYSIFSPCVKIIKKIYSFLYFKLFYNLQKREKIHEKKD